MQKSFSRLFCTLTLFLLAGCQVFTPPNFPTAPTPQPATVEPSPTTPPAATPVPPPASAGPDLALLRGATYALESAQAGSVTLVDGEYREPSAVIYAAETVVIFFQSAPGDLNQDGVPDAVVILNVNTGGTGRFFYLYAATLQDGNLIISAPVFLGDRVKINTLEIVQGEVRLDMLISGPNDGMCCPSQPASEIYALQNGQLTKLSQ